MSPVAPVLVSLVAIAGHAAAADASGVAAPAGTPQASPARAVAPRARDYDSPPPGSREDQALWKTAYDANKEVIIGINAATRLQLKAKTTQYVERLEALAAGGPGSAERAEGLRQRLLAAWNDNVDLVTRRWPIDPEHSCRYPLLTLEGVMFSSESPSKRSQLTQARFDVQQCLGQVLPALRDLERSNRDFEKLLSDLDRELGTVAR